ncbi:MAG TPA: hypothetical protein VK612_03210 [Pyrinomonadaceae bacterium]|nr:hypothetical protein [Pyrinomonadaceae bacterium]
MKYTSLIFIMAVVLFSGPVVYSQAALKMAVGSYLKKEAKDNAADEYAEARKIVTGDVDGDGDADAVVLYTLEGFGGGNFWVQSIAVFTNIRGMYKFAAKEDVGAKNGDRSVTLTKIEGGKIWLDSDVCAEPPQGLCDDGKKSKVYFTLVGKKLTESAGN